MCYWWLRRRETFYFAFSFNDLCKPAPSPRVSAHVSPQPWFEVALLSGASERVLQKLVVLQTFWSAMEALANEPDITKFKNFKFKTDFVHLFSTLKRWVTSVFGLTPSCGWQWLLSLRAWLSLACEAQRIPNIDIFNLVWNRRSLFRNDGIHLKWFGALLPSLSATIINIPGVPTPVPHAPLPLQDPLARPQFLLFLLFLLTVGQPILPPNPVATQTAALVIPTSHSCTLLPLLVTSRFCRSNNRTFYPGWPKVAQIPTYVSSVWHQIWTFHTIKLPPPRMSFIINELIVSYSFGSLLITSFAVRLWIRQAT